MDHHRRQRPSIRGAISNANTALPAKAVPAKNEPDVAGGVTRPRRRKSLETAAARPALGDVTNAGARRVRTERKAKGPTDAAKQRKSRRSKADVAADLFDDAADLFDQVLSYTKEKRE